MAESIRQGLRDLRLMLEQRLEIAEEMRREAEAIAVAQARRRPGAPTALVDASWITGTNLVFLDFGRGFRGRGRVQF